jgi:mono/diheme cytochrome c family protein
MKFIAALLIILLLIAGGVWTGIFNVSARVPHWNFTIKAIEIIRDRSIEVHSADLKLPAVNAPNPIVQGASVYQETCRECHGAPGVPAEVFAQGLYPAPADLLSGSVQKQWKENQLYWIVENGLKMTGMPAFASAYDQKELLGVVAFLGKLTGMTPEEYQGLTTGSQNKRAGM